MFHASSYAAAYDSGSDDYVSMDSEEMDGGIQQLGNISDSEDEMDEPAPLRVQKGMEEMSLKEVEEENKKSSTGSSLLGFLGFGKKSSNNNSNSNSNNQNDDNNVNALGSVSVSVSRDRSSAPSTRSASSRVIQKKFMKMKKKNKHRKKALSSRPSKTYNRQVAKKKVNTNVVSLDLSTLGNEANEVATGDAYVCQNKNCRVIFSMHDTCSPVKKSLMEQKANEAATGADGDKIWNCAFCHNVNKIDIEVEEIPKSDTIDYILEPAGDDLKSEEDNFIVFCIDISGSMCVTQEVDGSYKLKGNQLKTMQADLKQFGDGSNQYLDNQNRNTTWISRLASVQAAIDDQLSALQKSHPNYKVCLVSFANDVTIIGDGISKPEFIVGDKLQDMAKLQQIGAEYKLKKAISQSQKQLSKKLFALKETGQTALGPAIVTSIAIASQRRGSQVILCTDGLANIGLGSLDFESNEVPGAVLSEWYDNLGHLALNAGVTVNIISITDDQCQLEYLGKVADVSQGNVERINPLHLANNFSGILARSCLATNVQAKMLLPPMLLFKVDEDDELNLQRKKSVIQLPSNNTNNTNTNTNTNTNNSNSNSNNNNTGTDKDDSKENKSREEEEEEEIGFRISTLMRDIGNVFADSTVYFEYIIDRKLLKKPEYKNLKNVLFQVQISYTRLDGSKMMRVITQQKPISTDRKVVFESLNMNIIGANASRKSARLAEAGDYEAARAVTYSNSVWMASNARSVAQQDQMSSYINTNLNFDSMMQAQQQKEDKSIKYKSKKAKKASRKSARNDGISKTMYFQKKSRY